MAPGELGLVNLCSVAIDIAGDAVYPPCTSDWRFGRFYRFWRFVESISYV